MCHSGQLTQEEHRQRREQARGKAAPKDRRTSSAPEGEVDIPRATEQALLNPTDTAPDNADPGMGYIFEHTRGRKCLVFANSREEAEAVCSMLRSYCESRHEPDRFLIHHGNLSASLRETAEELMRDEEQAQTTVTTSTLELGIDIGRWSARSRSMRRLPSAPFCSVWAARDAAIFRPRCGSSCARKNPSRAR